MPRLFFARFIIFSFCLTFHDDLMLFSSTFFVADISYHRATIFMRFFRCPPYLRPDFTANITLDADALRLLFFLLLLFY